MIRKLSTLMFAAVPAVMYCYISLIFGMAALIDVVKHQAYGQLALIAFAFLAALGTLGLWRVTLTNNYKSKTNLLMIASGVFAVGSMYIVGLIERPSWYIPSGLNKDTLELISITLIFFYGLYYLAAISRGLCADK